VGHIIRGTATCRRVFGAPTAGLPLSIYRTFVSSSRFGFNRTSPRVFMVDQIKGWLSGCCSRAVTAWRLSIMTSAPELVDRRVASMDVLHVA